jgi:YidC/Oxa1 family membrane protein insertase
MQELGPKQKKIQERYKDDRKKLQQEMSRLFKEEGISPTGALGCLPMFLQMPIWIALYATLYFAFELRQQPGFFGLFQLIGGWPFLADLAEPDHAIPLGTGFSLPLMGTITAINVLPLVLGVVFYIQQKYLTPPPSASLTPEQAQQQKVMKIMMVVMFPLIMYNAPSGLSLYFIVNSTLGTLESRWIRSHAEKHGLFDRKPGQTKRKSGFMERLSQIAEERQKAIEQKHAKPGKRKR